VHTHILTYILEGVWESNLIPKILGLYTLRLKELDSLFD